jgi:hypothetical protein
MRLISQVFWALIVILLVLGGCATPKKTTTSTTSDGAQYSEDLSIWRPKAQPAKQDSSIKDGNIRPRTGIVEAKYSVNKTLDPILDSIDRINLRRNYIDGFTIQVYSGLNREDALNTKKQLTMSLPDLDSEVHYAQPNFRVKVGKYFPRLDAQKDYVDIKKVFPTAIVIPEKVAIN